VSREAVLRAVRTGLLIAVVTLLLLEIVLRAFLGAMLFLPDATTSDESLFWRHSRELGWALSPNRSGHFTNGGFDGLVTTDEYGLRRNSIAGTQQNDYENLLFIGDSTVASLEVNDDQTVPALLERLLRNRGRKVNVVNLGVRGYGTDQAVLSAQLHAARLRPTEVIYMYVGNDIYENNTIKSPHRRFGKGVFIREAGASSFIPVGFPVPDRDPAYGSLVVFDEACRPVVHVAESYEDPRSTRAGDRGGSSGVKEALLRSLYTLRALRYAKEQFSARQAPDTAQPDPHEAIAKHGVKWSRGFYAAYGDSGGLRKRCGQYFEDQIAFFISQLRAIGSIRKVHVVQFPNGPTLELLRQRQASPDSEYFARLLVRGIVNSHTNLSQILIDERISIQELQCLGDLHFCEKGNAWVADQILLRIVADPAKGSH
jgi:hypothetical protein